MSLSAPPAAIHYLAEIQKPEGVYRARLYSRLKWWKYNVGGTIYRQGARLTTDMRHHIDNIPNFANPVLIEGDVVKESGLGAKASKLDNELQQGIIAIDNYALTFEPDPILHDLIDAIRDRDQEVWLELTLEQTPDVPRIHEPNTVITESRKTRSLYWGRLIRNEAKGKVDVQNFPSPLLKDADAEIHIGEFACSFQNWFSIACAGDGKLFLNDYLDSYPLPTDWTLPVSDLFYRLFFYITPVNLCAFGDDRLHTETDLPNLDSVKSVSRCNFRLHFALTDPTKTYFARDLWHVRFERSLNGANSKLFDSTSNAPDVSLYKQWPTLGDAAIKLARDFRFKFQCELPTFDAFKHFLDTAYLHFDNVSSDRTTYWDATARWYFCEPFYNPLKIALSKMTVKENTIEYTPAAVYTNKIDIKSPTFEYANVDAVCGGGGLVFVPDSGTSGTMDSDEIVTSPSFVADEPGQEISWETLFRLGFFVTGNCYDPATDTYGPSISVPVGGGNTLFIWDDGTSALYGSQYVTETNFSIPGTDLTYIASWSMFHFFSEEARWWACRALLEFEIEGTGIMDFSTQKNFDLLDWGEFPHFRIFDASPGILFNKSDGKPIIGIFSIFDISQTPGGTTKIRAIELKDFVPVSLPDIVMKTVLGPPPCGTGPGESGIPCPPRIDTPPVFSGSPVCGTITVTFCVVYGGGCVTKADVTLNGVAFGTVNNFPNPMPDDCVPVTVVINTANLPNGANVVCITVTLCDTTTVGPVCWTFNVNNPCTGGNTPQKLFSA